MASLRCHSNSDHNKFSSLSNTSEVAIIPNLCLWRCGLSLNVGGIDPKKLYRATFTEGASFSHCFSHCALRFPELQLSATSVKTFLRSLNYRRTPKGAYLSIMLVNFV